jgi:hypothetical protein
VVHARLRGGPANSGRGSGHFLAECFARLRDAGAKGRSRCAPIPASTAARWSGPAARPGPASPSRSGSTPSPRSLIEAIPEQASTPIPYWFDGAADVTEDQLPTLREE